MHPSALLDLLAPPTCLACGRHGALPWCGSCEATAPRLRPRAVDVDGIPVPVVAAYAYRGVVADAVVGAKVRGARAAWGPLGERLADHVVRARVTVDVVVPVPTEPRRRRRRGVDHTAVLAVRVAEALDAPLVPAIAARRGAPDQGRRGRHLGRLPPGTFRPTRRLTGCTVGLVDDVVTSGATVRAALEALAVAGATSAVVLALARSGAVA